MAKSPDLAIIFMLTIDKTDSFIPCAYARGKLLILPLVHMRVE